MKKKPITNNLFWTYFKSYLAITLLTCSIVLCIVAGILLSNKRISMNVAFSESCNDIMYRTNLVQQELLNLSGDITDIITGIDEYDNNDISKSLKAMAYYAPLPCDAFHYQTGTTEMITADGTVKYSIFEKQLMSQYKLSHCAFFTNLNNSTAQTVMAIPDTEGQCNIMYMYQNPYLSYHAEAKTFFIIRGDTIQADFDEYFNYSNIDYLICDSLSNILYTSNTSSYNTTTLDLLEHNDSDSYLSEWNNQVYTKAVSFNSGYSYYAFVDKDEYYHEFYLLLFYIIGASLIVLSLAVLLSYYSAKKQYLPLSEVFDIIDGLYNSKKINQIHEISEYIKMANKEHQNTLTHSEEMSRYLKVDVFTSILYDNSLNSSEIKNKLERASLVNLEKNFLVLISKEGEFHYLDRFMEFPFEDSSLFFINQKHRNFMVVILNIPDTQDTYGLATRAAKHINSLVGSTVSWGAGSITDIDNIRISFIEAREALYHHDGIHIVSKYEYMQENICFPYIIPSIYENLIIEGVHIGDKSIILSTIQKIFDNVAPENLSYNFVQALYFNIFSMCFKALVKNNVNTAEKSIFNITLINNNKEFLSSIDEYLELHLPQHVLEKNTAEITFKEEIFKYFLQNYMDADMSLTMLCDEFDTSPTYISKFFKDKLGYGFSEYLTNLRLEKFKTLLIETSLSQQVLINQVGYSDLSSFIRKFKQKEGMTPGEYRKKYQSTSQN